MDPLVSLRTSLLLRILRCPDYATPESRRVPGGALSIGRGPGVDWVLADPDRHLSKLHCTVTEGRSGWEIVDGSTNGTFLNQSADPIGPTPHPVQAGDRLRLGSYEIEVREEAAREAAPGYLAPASWPPEDRSFLGKPARKSSHEPAKSSDFSMLGEDFGVDFTGPTQPNNAPGINDPFPPPRAGLDLPPDWRPVLGEPADPLPPSAPPPAALPAHAPQGSCEDLRAGSCEDLRAGSCEDLRAGPNPFVTPAARADPAPDAPPLAPGEDRLLVAFLRGAGMPKLRPEAPEATMEALGAAFRAMVAGLRATMIARADVKSSFRIEQTRIQRRGNNPLKFAADDDDALLGLLDPVRRGVEPRVAISEALRDLRLHELASVTAMQAAAHALVQSLAPAAVDAALPHRPVDLWPKGRRARLWSAAVARHGRIEAALADDFDSAFGRAFALAYEEAMAELKERAP